jgi:hypothetical protein
MFQDNPFRSSYLARIDYSQRVFDSSTEDNLVRDIFHALGSKLRSSYQDTKLHTELFGAPLAPVVLEDPHELEGYNLLGRYRHIRISPEQDLDSPGIKRKEYFLKNPETRIYFKSDLPRPLKENSFEEDIKLGMHVKVEEKETILSPAIVTTGQIVLHKPRNQKELANAARGFFRFAGNLNRKISELVPAEYAFESGELYGPNNLQVIELSQEYIDGLSTTVYGELDPLVPKCRRKMLIFRQTYHGKKSDCLNVGINYECSGHKKGTVIATNKELGSLVMDASIEKEL